MQPVVNAENGTGTTVAMHPMTLQGYDTFGAPTHAADANGNVTTTTYDADGGSTRWPAGALFPACPVRREAPCCIPSAAGAPAACGPCTGGTRGAGLGHPRRRRRPLP